MQSFAGWMLFLTPTMEQKMHIGLHLFCRRGVTSFCVDFSDASTQVEVKTDIAKETLRTVDNCLVCVIRASNSPGLE